MSTLIPSQFGKPLRLEAFLEGFPGVSNVDGVNYCNLVKTDNSPLNYAITKILR